MLRSSSRRIDSNERVYNFVQGRTSKGGEVAVIINDKLKFELICIPSEINEEILEATINSKS